MLVKTDTKLVYAVFRREEKRGSQRQLLSPDPVSVCVVYVNGLWLQQLLLQLPPSFSLSFFPVFSSRLVLLLQEMEQKNQRTKKVAKVTGRGWGGEEKTFSAGSCVLCFCTLSEPFGEHFSGFAFVSRSGSSLDPIASFFPPSSQLFSLSMHSRREKEKRMERQATRGAEEISHYLSHSHGLQRDLLPVLRSSFFSLLLSCHPLSQGCGERRAVYTLCLVYVPPADLASLSLFSSLFTYTYRSDVCGNGCRQKEGEKEAGLGADSLSHWLYYTLPFNRPINHLQSCLNFCPSSEFLNHAPRLIQFYVQPEAWHTVRQHTGTERTRFKHTQSVRTIRATVSLFARPVRFAGN